MKKSKKHQHRQHTSDQILTVGFSFLTPTVFSQLVEAKVSSASIGILEAIQLVCEERRIEYESVRGLLTKPLKMALTVQASVANLLKNKSKPLDL